MAHPKGDIEPLLIGYMLDVLVDFGIIDLAALTGGDATGGMLGELAPRS